MDSFWEKKKNETRSALSFFDEFFKNLIILQNQNEERKRNLLRVFSFIQDPLGRPFQKLILKRGGKNLNHR